MNWICKQKRWISIGCFLITCVFVVFGYQSGIFTDTQKMQAFLERAGVLAPLVFMAIQAVQVVIPILPGAIGCVFGVVFFGAVKGFLYNYIGICIGSVAAFLLARACGQDLVQQMTGAKVYQNNSMYFLQEMQVDRIYALLIFLPVAPDDFLCYLAGTTNMTWKQFVTVIFLGKPFSIALYSLGLTTLFQVIFHLL